MTQSAYIQHIKWSPPHPNHLHCFPQPRLLLNQLRFYSWPPPKVPPTSSSAPSYRTSTGCRSRSSTTSPLHVCPISSLSPPLQPAPSDPPALSTSLCPLPAPAPWELSFQPLCHSLASTIPNPDSLLLFKSTFKMPTICPFNSFIFVFYCLTLCIVLECLINRKHS